MKQEALRNSRSRVPSKLLSLAILISFQAAALGLQGQVPAAAPNETFVRAVEAIKGGNLEEAELLLSQLVDKGMVTPEVRHNLGIVYLQQKRFDRAAEQFREALRSNPDLHASRALLGASLRASGRTAEAAVELERAIPGLPGETLPLLELGRAYEEAGDPIRATSAYRRLADLSPGDPDSLYLLGKSYMTLAEWSYQKLREVAPESARVQQALGHSYQAQGKLKEAEEAFRKACDLGPDIPDLHLDLAAVYLRQNKLAEALAEIQKELLLVPDNLGAQRLYQQVSAQLPGGAVP